MYINTLRRITSTGIQHKLTCRQQFIGSQALVTQTQRRLYSMSKSRGHLLGLGNPLLDITVRTDAAFLDRYGLAANDAVIAAGELLKLDLFAEIQKPDFSPIYGAGGATQNAIRVAQWMLQEEGSTSFIGCVGNDKQGEILREKANSDGVQVRYLVDNEHSTGVCGALITGDQRSLVADLGAAEFLRSDWLKDDHNWAVVRRATAFYMAAFLFETCPEAIHAVLEHAVRHDKLVAMNLSSAALCRFFTDASSGESKEAATDIIGQVDVLFGNGVEATRLCADLGLDPDLDFKQMAMAMANITKVNTKRKRIVVITRGTKNTVVANAGDDSVGEYAINAISRCDIKDTNGCGDAFVGGFLSQLIQHRPLEECIRCGHYAAHTIVQHWGCSYTAKPNFK